MNLIKKNIWTLFILIIVAGLILISIFSYSLWKNIYQKHSSKLVANTNLIHRVVDSQFHTHETILSLLGKELSKIDFSSNSYKPKKDKFLFDRLMDVDPAIAAFGLLNTKGDYIYISSNAEVENLPNLIRQKESRDTFLYTLTKTKMIIGRTYFFKPLNKRVIPIRKTIRNEDNEVVAVMTAALNILNNSSVSNSSKLESDGNRIYILRNYDNYLQYVSHEEVDNSWSYNDPVPEIDISNIKQSLKKKYNVSFEKMKISEKTYVVSYKNYQKRNILAALKYNNYFELWSIAIVPLNELFKEWGFSVFKIFSLFVIFILLLYFSFRAVSNSEKRRKEDLIKLATTDQLTKLPNRNYLRKFISQIINEEESPFSLFYIDMDHFKYVNDSFGHDYGDKILVDLANRLKNIAAQKITVIRHGGDEFILIVYETDKDSIINLGEKVIQIITQPYEINNFNFTLGASLGIAVYPDHAENFNELISAADTAMYNSKQNKNNCSLFVPEMRIELQQKIKIEQYLRQAIEKEELYMVYQPQVDEHGVLCGTESLIRWESKELGFIPPDVFIPVAESTGQINQIGEFILQRVLSDIKIIDKNKVDSFSVSINISIKQLLQTDFLQNIMDYCRECSKHQIKVVLEITESLFIEDIDYINPLLKKVNESGIDISLDDFGTGYSSLNILRLLPINELKIDKSFIKDISVDKSAQNMIKNIIAIGKNLNLTVLAEGVETAEDVAILKRYGCDRFQGYYYARPMKIEKLKDYIDKI